MFIIVLGQHVSILREDITYQAQHYCIAFNVLTFQRLYTYLVISNNIYNKF